MPPTYSAVTGFTNPRSVVDVVTHDHGDAGRDVEVGARLVVPRLGEAGVERGAVRLGEPVGREEDRQPPVGDLGGELDVLRPDGRDVDRDVGAGTADDLQRLAEPGRARSRVRDVVVLAVVLERFLAAQDRAHDLDVLARLRQRLAVRLAVPALDDLRARQPQPEQEPAAAHQVERRRRHRGHRRRARRHLHDRRAAT